MLALGRKTRRNRTHFSLSAEVQEAGEGAVFPQTEGEARFHSHRKSPQIQTFSLHSNSIWHPYWLLLNSSGQKHFIFHPSSVKVSWFYGLFADNIIL